MQGIIIFHAAFACLFPKSRKRWKHGYRVNIFLHVLMLASVKASVRFHEEPNFKSSLKKYTFIYNVNLENNYKEMPSNTMNST